MVFINRAAKIQRYFRIINYLLKILYKFFLKKSFFMNIQTQKLAISLQEWTQLWQNAFNKNSSEVEKIRLLTYANYQNLTREQWEIILQVFKNQRVSLNLNKFSQTILVLPFLENENIKTFVFGLAVAAILSAMGQVVLLVGEKNPNTNLGLADILPVQYFSKTNSVVQNNLQNDKIAFLNAADWVENWSDWSEIRANFDTENIFGCLQPLIWVDAGMNMILGLDSWARGRFYQNLGFGLHENEFFLHDKSGSSWISLCHDWQWATAAGLQTYTVDNQLFTKQITNYFNTEKTENKTAENKTAAQAFSYLQRLLSNDISSTERDLLLINAAFLACQTQTNWSLYGAIAEAEAALSSGRAKILFNV
jgi:anthranilate phosphoribosyltransferase